jgi:DNA helicase-2/ATP-dependent DNA helicase PcrA
MTLHAAKGLEFPCVFLVGMEDGLFPSQRAIDEGGAAQLEEERRLAYVGITRARRHLTLSYAESRRLRGQETYNRPSRFLAEIPANTMVEVRPRAHLSRQASFGARPRAASDDWGDQPAIGLGTRVSHAQFGDGVIIGAEGQGNHARVQVNFEDVGSKWLVLAYANLVVLG